MRRFLIPLVLVLSAGCLHPVRLKESIDEPFALKQAVLYNVPPGTSLVEAQRFMESEGFSCRLEKNAKIDVKVWDENGKDKEEHKVYEGVDHLFCQYSRGYQHFWVTLILKDERVIDVDAVRHATGMKMGWWDMRGIFY